MRAPQNEATAGWQAYLDRPASAQLSQFNTPVVAPSAAVVAMVRPARCVSSFSDRLTGSRGTIDKVCLVSPDSHHSTLRS